MADTYPVLARKRRSGGKSIKIPGEVAEWFKAAA